MNMINQLVRSCSQLLNDIEAENDESVYEYINSIQMLCSYFDQQKLDIIDKAVHEHQNSALLHQLKFRICREKSMFEEAYSSIKNAADILWEEKIIYGELAVNLGLLAIRFNDLTIIEEQAHRLLEVNANVDALEYYFENVLSKVKNEVSKSLLQRFDLV